MRAARLLPGRDRLVIEQVPRPVPADHEVLVKVSGAGVCRSDIHVLDGLFEHSVARPVTPGHEIAGVVEEIGPGVTSIGVGEAVVVMVGWGCGSCHWCRSGHEQICPNGREAGATVDGGFAEFVLVPHERFAVPIRAIPLAEATPLGCAALSAYAGVQRVLPALAQGGALVVIGAGGLGQYAVHLARRLSDARIIAVDTRPESREQALAAGAHHAVTDRSDIRDLCEPLGARAVLDFVGTDATLALAAEAVGPRGVIALLGLAGGTLTLGFETLAPEASFTTVVAGTLADLVSLVDVYQSDRLAVPLHPYSLDAVNDALADLRAGRIVGRAVITP